MSDGIRIDELPSTAVPTATHLIPAMKDGLTVKLQLSQIASLVAGVGGVLPSTGGTLTGGLTISYAAPEITFVKTPGQMSGLTWKNTVNSTRWRLLSDATGETGSDAGSNFTLTAYLDNATAVSAWTVERKTGQMTFHVDPLIKNVNPTLTLDKTASSGEDAQIIGTKGGLKRWALSLGNTEAESTGNAGANLWLRRYNDGGTVIDTPLTMNRATGQARFWEPLSVAGLVSQPKVAGNSHLVCNDHTGASKAWFTWELSDDTARVMHGSGETISLYSNGTMIAGKGIAGRAGTAGVIQGTVHNFYWAGGATVQCWIDATNLGNVSFSSDYRIKKDVTDLAPTWDQVKALRPISYTQADYAPLFVADEILRWGFIAHELQETLLPSAATGEKDAQGVIQSPNPWSVIAALTKALQEAMARIEALEGGPALARQAAPAPTRAPPAVEPQITARPRKRHGGPDGRA